MKFFNFGGKEAATEKQETPAQEVSVDRAAELVFDNEAVCAALKEYNDLLAFMNFGGGTTEDRLLSLTERSEAVVAALAAAGYSLEFTPSPYNASEDESVALLAKLYAEEAEGETPLAA